MPFKYTDITDNNQLSKLCGSLSDRGVSRLALDFEGEFNLHVYGERLCLIQVFDGTSYFLVDPFGISQDVLSRFLTLKNMLYVFFAADSDRSLVFKQYNIKMHGVYDIQHLVEVLDLPGKGLDAVLETELGVVVEHKKKYQRQNWITRPIEEGAKQYALSDVAHLFDLHSSLLKKIIEQNKVEELVFKLAGSFKDYDKKFIPGIFKIPAYLKMSREKKARYEKIVDLRESLAKELNVPAAIILSKEDLVQVTENPEQIRRVQFDRRIPGSRRDRFIQELLRLA